MQQRDNGQIIYSPSDLVTFLGCNHASFLDAKALGEELAKTEADEMSDLLKRKGLEHEESYLAQLKDEDRVIAEIPQNLSTEERAKQTIEAMQSGVDVIYQAVLFAPPWQGYADFLIKCDTPSDLGDFSYEVLDTKLARAPEPKHIIQLSVYSALLTELQGGCPANMHLFLGNHEKHSFQVAEFSHYYKQVKTRFENYLKNLPSQSSPEPCKQCNLCQWREICTAQWERDDHLSLVANIRRTHIDKLRKHDLHTVADLANAAEDTKVPDLNHDLFMRLRAQARLQHHKATTGEDRYEIIPFSYGKGFSRLPPPNDGDLFFDMEGDPLYPSGLEYLFGLYYFLDGKERFMPLWAHNHEDEREQYDAFLSFVGIHLEDYPDAHIYHYNHYETTALKRLACRYALREWQLDDLLRRQKFVDLYPVVRESIRTSEPGYSLKNLEAFYMGRREEEISSAADSIVYYNQWRELCGRHIIDADPDSLRAIPESAEQAKELAEGSQILEKIKEYNKVDCISTRLLRDWLITLKPDNLSSISEARKGKDTKPDEGSLDDWESEYHQYDVELTIKADDPSPVNHRLSHLLEFHNREAKPQWWSMFDRMSKYEDELIDDTECLGGLQQVGQPESDEGAMIYTYQFPPQEYKLKAGSQPIDAATTKLVGTVIEINEHDCIIKIKRGGKEAELPARFSLAPPKPIDASIIRDALYGYADILLLFPDAEHVQTELLKRELPRFQGKKSGTPLVTSKDVIGDAQKAIARLKSSYLFLQGPPGAGKTYTSSHLIVELMKRGNDVGVTSNSHKAIHNLLRKVEEVAAEKGVEFIGLKKASVSNEESFYEGRFISSETRMENIARSEAGLLAGTAWTFAHEFIEGALDYLFIDEAGQVSVANVVAMARSTQNIILVGDQMQLGQPIQGTHPGEAGLSVLEFLLGDEATIAPERGIFLAETYRMRPSVCTFISDAFYDGRLKPHKSTSKRCLRLHDPVLPDEGVVVIPAAHEGCAQKSTIEGEIIKEKYEAMLGKDFTDQDGTTRPITEADILVVSPYNVQVNYLTSILPQDARVGTVDKFQGQEAPIVLISMVTSSAEDLPRNIEFLYSRNRLNVAISRAQCLAIVVANPKLLEVPCNTVEQMRLVNTFCWLYDYATVLS